MDVPDDQGLLVVNLDNCISSTASEQVVKGDCVYAVAVTSSSCGDEDGTIIQIPVSVHCSGGTHQQYTTVDTLEQQSYSEVQSHQYAQMNVEDQISCLDPDNNRLHGRDEINPEERLPLPQTDQSQADDTDSYYAEIFNYIVALTVPDGVTESYKKILKKRARNYTVWEGALYYGHKKSKRVITKISEQREILKEVHVEKQTGVHLGLKKMYMAIYQNYFWKGLYVDVANFVRQCKQCSESITIAGTEIDESQLLEKSRDSDVVPEDKSAGHGNSNNVWQKVELNILGPYPRTVNENEFIITITDPFSRWIVARPMCNSSSFAEYVADFVCKTFCTFGFTKCNCVGISEEVLETLKHRYQENVSHLHDTLLICGSLSNLPQNLASVQTSLLFLPEKMSECTWIKKLWDDFVAVNPETWDMEIEKFLFKYCTLSGQDSSSPFVSMFRRNPVSCLEEDKENCNFSVTERPAEITSKRRRLQSSVLQCRHCEEIFTSKISFRIHQRKHTDEARRQGTLEGQEPLRTAAEREKRLLRRSALKRKQRLLRHGVKDDDKTSQHSKSSIKSPLVDNKQSEDTRNSENVSESRLLLVETDSIDNTSASSSPLPLSSNNCRDEVPRDNNKTSEEFVGIGNDHNGEENVAVLKRNDITVQTLDQSSDINIVVYTEPDEASEAHTEGRNVQCLNDTKQLGSQDAKMDSIRSKVHNENESVENNVDVHKIFLCEKCNKKFDSKSRFTAHMYQHSSPLLQCSQCLYTTKSSKLLEYHQNIHSEKYKCKFCSKLFTRKIYLKYHIKDIHRKTRRLHNCEECNAKFLSLSGLKMHIQSTHEVQQYSCTLCNYTGKSANTLSSHMARSHKKKFKCGTCEYESLTQSALDRHTKLYHNCDDRQFACRYCSYHGEKQRQLLDHEKTVHGESKNRHICPVCKKFFRTQVMMKHHLPSHSEQQLFSCKGCNYKTRFRQTLHVHIKASHPGESFKTLGKGPTDEDFQNIITTAMNNQEQLRAEEHMQVDFITQVPDDCHILENPDNLLNATVLSEQSPQSLPNSQNMSQEIPIGQGFTLQRCQTNEPVNSSDLTECMLATEKIQTDDEKMSDSDQAVAVTDNSNEMETIVNLTGNMHSSKEEVQSIFPLHTFNLEDSRLHQVVTLVDSLDSGEGASQPTVMLLNNVVQHQTSESATVTHISLIDDHHSNEENLVILPLGNSKVAIIQNENYSTIQDPNPLVLGASGPLLDIIADQRALAGQQQSAENINQLTVYRLDE